MGNHGKPELSQILPSAQEFDLSRGRVLNQARFEAFGRSCEITVGGTVEAVQPAAVMSGGTQKRQQRGSGGSGGAKAATAAAAEPEMPPGADRPGRLRLAAPKKGEGGGAHERE